jgi:7-cyano-7-deazaguanine synthase
MNFQEDLQMQQSKKALVIFSGGMDSTAAALWAIDKGYEQVELVTFRFGDERRQYGELSASAQVAQYLNLTHTILDVKIPFSAYPLTNQPFCQHAEMKDPAESLNQFGVLPFNVAFHLIYGASFAAMRGCADIIWGAIKDEAEISADFRQEYSEMMTSLLQASGSVTEKMRVLTPLVDQHKWELAEIYRDKQALFHLTWSCKHSTTLTQCGVCYGCEGRRLASRIAGLQDKTDYAHPLVSPFDELTIDDINNKKVDMKRLSEYVRGSGKGVVVPTR